MTSSDEQTAADVTRALARLAQPQQRAYFFDRLENPTWVRELRKQHAFDNPPDPIPGDKEGYVMYPPWPEGSYLTRMARKRRAAPLLDRRNQLRHELDRVHQHVTVDRRLVWALEDRESIVAVAKQTVDALHTWQHRATGHNVAPERLADAVDVLHHTDQADHTALAAPLATWMDQHGLTPQQPSIEPDLPRIEPLGLDIGF